MTLNKIDVPSVKESFVRELENKILSGELKIGEKLPTAKELCSLMGVSQTTVNAGMSELAALGFVEIRPRKGTYVSDYRVNGTPETLFAVMRYNGGRLNSEDVRSFCEYRIAMDPFAAELIINRASDEEIDSLLPILDKLRAERNIELFCVYITDFFKRFYALTGNAIISMMYNSGVLPQRGMYKTFIEKNGFETVVENAEEVYALLKARDIPAVRKCLTEAMLLPISRETSIL